MTVVPTIQEFKRLLKIDTWNEDRKLTLKDLTSNALVDEQKVGVQQCSCPMITTLQVLNDLFLLGG